MASNNWIICPIAKINKHNIKPQNQINNINEKLNSVVRQVPEYKVELEPQVGNKFPNKIPTIKIIKNTTTANIW